MIMPKANPGLTSNLVKVESVSHPFVIFFHNSTPKTLTGSKEHRYSTPSLSLKPIAPAIYLREIKHYQIPDTQPLTPQ